MAPIFLVSSARSSYSRTFSRPQSVWIDDDELLSGEQVMRHDQRWQGIFGGNPPGLADHVRVAWPEAKTMLEEDPGIHAGEDSDAVLGSHRKLAQLEVARDGFVG